MSVIYDIGGTSNNCFSINGKANILQGDEDPKNIQGQNGDIYLQSIGKLWSKRNDQWQAVESSTASWPLPTKNNQLVTVSPSETGFDVSYTNATAEDFDYIAFYTKENTFVETNTFNGTTNLAKTNITGDITSSGNNTWSGKNTFTQTIQGTALNALWGDLAEFYESDNEYPKGTLVKFGGEKEITIANDEVNAVITSQPGVLLNSQMENGQAIALCGRVPVRVIGKVNKFEYLTLSEIPGVARALDDEEFSMNVVARALEDKETEEEGLVLCVVKFDI